MLLLPHCLKDEINSKMHWRVISCQCNIAGTILTRKALWRDLSKFIYFASVLVEIMTESVNLGYETLSTAPE